MGSDQTLCGCGKADCNSYVATDIKVMTGLEAIRKRPFMYVGPLDDAMLPTRLLQEALCVACDKVSEVSQVQVTLGPLIGEARVSFDASFPVALDERSGKRLSELILTQLFTCRTLRGPGAKELCTIGLVSLVALSSELHFDTCSEGYEWLQTFQEGVPGPFTQSVECDAKRTEFMFTLDESILGTNRRFNTEAIRTWLAESFAPEQFTVDDFQPSP